MLKKQPSIEAAWNAYVSLVLPHEQLAILAEAKLAFFAGASVLFHGMMRGLDPGEEPTTADLDRMDKIYAEVKAFTATFDDEVFRRTGRPP